VIRADNPAGPNIAGIVFDDVSVKMGGVTILENISASIPHGSAAAIIGPNGAGKTTLLLAMLGQIPHGGRITIHGQTTLPRIGYVPQRLDFDRNMPVTVMDMMVMGRQRLPLWFGTRSRHRRAAMEILSSVKAEHLANRRLGVLSGGELQRVLLGLAIQQDPHVLLLDEPSAGVDVSGESLLCELLEKLRAQRAFTQVMVTHDLSLVTAHATHVICLNHRVLGFGPTRATLSSKVLLATFGIHLGLADLDTASNGQAPACHSEACHHD
jgi:zinc transport system ATP-binding protein